MVGRMGSVIEEVTGIAPRAVVVIGPGFVREEFKTLCFQRGKSLSAHAMLNPRQLAQVLVPHSRNRILERFARIQLLKECIKNPNLKEALPCILEHRFRPRFFETLDRTLSHGRTLFVNSAEAEVFEARLKEKRGYDEKREEFFLLNRFWERLLEVRELWDEARVFQDATESLRAGKERLPIEKVYWLEHGAASPRVRYFQETIGANATFERIHSFQSVDTPTPLMLKTAHSPEDVAHFILDEILNDEDPQKHAVVIEDRPEIRRTIKRAAQERGFDLMDPRDPTLIHQSEEIKTALLELELAAKDFPRELVLSYWSIVEKNPGEMRKKVIEQGIIGGFDSYAHIPELTQRLTAIRELFPSRLNLEHLSQSCLKSIRRLGLSFPIEQMVTRVFESMKKDAVLLDSISRKKPLRLWLVDLENRLKESTPILSPLKHKNGLMLYRVDQAVALNLPQSVRIHMMGIRPEFFESREEGTEWFSVQDMEALAHEFQLPSRESRAKQARESFVSWVRASQLPVQFYESSYSESGDELDTSILALQSFSELAINVDETGAKAHPALLPSMTGRLSRAKRSERVSVSAREFPISFMNAYGNCPFTALASHLLALKDERDPDFDLDPDIYGTLVHKAIEILLMSKGEKTPQQSFREAWQKVALLGWVKSERMYRAFERNANQLLEKFLDSEKEFREFSRSEPWLFESPIELEREGIKLKGRIDRVDRHPDGLVVIDYKTASRVPSARDTLEKGKGLQMPLYALALRDAHRSEVVSAQYLTLKPEKVSRNSGFLFKTWNKGSKKDEVEIPLSKVRSNSGSLLAEPPESVWEQMDARIKGLISKMKDGDFSPAPADPKDCPQCRFSRVCGVNRGVIPSTVGEEC